MGRDGGGAMREGQEAKCAGWVGEWGGMGVGL